MKRKELPVEYLRECFDYTPGTGDLIWKNRPMSHFKCEQAYKRFSTMYAGKNAGFATVDGNTCYLVLTVNRKNYLAHRVIYAMHYGVWPDLDIDHINGDGLDNRIDNLRSVDSSTNRKNSRMWSHNKSGVTGVAWHKRNKTWEAYISVDKKQIHLGYFRDFESACISRELAENGKGYTDRHGKQKGN